MNIPKLRIVPFILASAAALALAGGFFILSTEVFLYSALPLIAGMVFYFVLSLSTGKPKAAEVVFSELLLGAELLLLLFALNGIYDFHGVWGHAGHYEETVENGWTDRKYYLGSRFTEGAPLVAESYGGEIRDCITDIDGDGKNELVCNTKTLADSRREAVVYDDSESGILRGTLDRGAFGIDEENLSQTEYDAKENGFLIRWYDQSGTEQTEKISCEEAVFTFSPLS